MLDETHPAHVGGEIIDEFRVLERIVAGLFFLQIELQFFDFREALEPFIERLHVHGADIGAAILEQVGDEVASDESAAAAYDYFVIHEEKNWGKKNERLLIS